MSRLWQIVVSLSVVVTLCATSFIFPAHAQTELDVLVSTNSYVQHTYQELLNLIRDVRNIGQNIGDDSDQQSIQECVNKFADFESAIQTALLATYQQNSDFGNLYYLLSDFESIANQVRQQTSLLESLISVSGSGSASSFSGLIADIYNVVDEALAVSNLYFYDFESLSAFILWSFYPGSSFAGNLNGYPAISIPSGENANPSYNVVNRIYSYPNSDIMLAFYTNTNFTRENFPFSFSDPSLSSNISVSYSEYVFSQYRRLERVIVHNSGNTGVELSFTWTGIGTRVVVPVYFGDVRFLSDRMQSITQYDPDILLKDLQETNISWFERIYNVLVGDPDTSNQVNQDIESLIDKVSDIQDSLDNYSDQLDSNIDFINPSSLLQKVDQQGQKVNFLSGIIQQLYGSFGEYAWIFFVPLIMALILLFMG